MTDFTMKQNDTSPAISYILKDADSNVVDLTGALAIRFHMVSQDKQTVKVDAAGSVVGAATSGEVKYQWLPADTDTAATWLAEFEITYADGNIETFPNGDNLKIKIVDDLA